MALLGHIAQGTAHATPMSGDRKFALKVQAPEDGTITALYADIQNDGIDIQALRAGVYNDATVIANATLVDQGNTVLVSPGTPRTWVALDSGLACPIVAGNFYWLTLHAGLAGGNASFWYDAGVGNELVADDTFADGLAATFGTPTQLANAIAMYVSYTPTSGTGAVRGLSLVPTYAGWK
jgi:hypothetical protein